MYVYIGIKLAARLSRSWEHFLFTVTECISNNNLSVSHCDVSSLSSFQPPAFLQLRTTDLLVPVGLPALYSCAADTEVSTEYKTSGSMPEH